MAGQNGKSDNNYKPRNNKGDLSEEEDDDFMDVNEDAASTSNTVFYLHCPRRSCLESKEIIGACPPLPDVDVIEIDDESEDEIRPGEHFSIRVEHSDIDLAASPPPVRLPHCKHFFLGLGSGGGVLFLRANIFSSAKCSVHRPPRLSLQIPAHVVAAGGLALPVPVQGADTPLCGSHARPPGLGKLGNLRADATGAGWRDAAPAAAAASGSAKHGVGRGGMRVEFLPSSFELRDLNFDENFR
ncbi:hypothetical protein B0H14DRAFT_2583315 [Mycena olivaceomarginata]|nr:hypothetical protein B0H14DRAFT_2583315 [Mycena olivaceomarginata]